MNKKFFVLFLTIFLLLMLIGSVSAGQEAQEAPPCFTNTWTGSVDQDWGTDGNWSCGSVPTIVSSVIIPVTASPNFPVVNAPDDISVNNLTVDSGASLDLNGRNIFVASSLVNNGTLIDRREIATANLTFDTCFFCTGGYAGLILSRNEIGGFNNPGVVEVQIKGNQTSCATGSTTISRCFDIQPTETNNISINAIFIFDPTELNGLVCDQLQIYRYNGSSWVPAGTHILNDCKSTLLSPDYSIVTAGITDFSPFAGSTGTPTAVNLINFEQSSSATFVIVLGAVLLLLVISLLAIGVRRVKNQA